MSGNDFTVDRRTVIKGGLLAAGVGIVPGVTSATDSSDQKFVPGYESDKAPSGQVNVTEVSPAAPEPVTVPAGNFIEHRITLIGGTRKAAEWWQGDTNVTFTIEGENTGNLEDSEYASIEQWDEIELAGGTVVKDVWVVNIAYVTNPQSPGTYELKSELEITTESPSRGDVLTRIEPMTMRPQSTYIVEPRGKN
ncbi:hypothetical protein OB919_20695 [Halobacteria archaeon AArc-curdl1]|uniref:Uncharacterized protein n=1 Tax=Natronosalvus hydrolyticus TaxID=2979988 RepID=A0AAP3E854_9EURY|nr:hypothetical protein [Halobacteria archaeon AArc-curdl1]